MIKVAIKLLPLILILFVAPVLADRTGEDLLEQCHEWKKYYAHGSSDPNVAYKAGECIAYIQGVADSLYVQKKYCPARSISTQRTRAVIKYLEKHPSLLEEDKMQAVTQALIGSYPCN